MKVGASEHHPGLTVRWVRYGEGVLFMRCRQHGKLLFVVRHARRVWWVDSYRPRTALRGVTRRCDAKRAAEVLVGQWWRDKCERQVLRRRHQRALLAEGVPLLERLAISACAVRNKATK